MSQEEIIQKVRETIKSDPNKNYIQRVYLFGSVLHGNEKKDSDVDLLFEMKKTMSLFQIFAVQKKLEDAIGRKVDFIEKDSLDKYIRDEVLAEAEKIYDEK